MKRVVGILSGKGGVGKTTIALNLGLAMHKLGEDIVVMDGDLKNPNFGLHLGVLNHDITVHDVLERGISLLEALHTHKSGLRFIPAHLSLHYLNTDSTELKNALSDFDFQVLVDSSPGLDRGVISVLESCDEILIVTNPHLPALTDCLKTIQVAKDMGVMIRGIVLNSVRKKGYEISAEEIETVSGTKVIQSIPYDENVLKSLALKTPLVEAKPLSPASIASFQLASELSGKEYKLPRFLRMRRIFSR